MRARVRARARAWAKCPAYLLPGLVQLSVHVFVFELGFYLDNRGELWIIVIPPHFKRIRGLLSFISLSHMNLHMGFGRFGCFLAGFHLYMETALWSSLLYFACSIEDHLPLLYPDPYFFFDSTPALPIHISFLVISNDGQ